MKNTDVARARADMPPETGRILERRSLADAHRRLAALLEPGLTVLDVGCGSGAITRDIADVVGPDGLVVGADISETLLAQGHDHRHLAPSLRFVRADIYALPFGRAFDIVTAARVVQWLARPLDAIIALSGAVRPGGTLIVLDYDHARIRWRPPPPNSMRDFYAAFLSWRREAGFDNSIVQRLPSMFDSTRIVDIVVTPQQESAVRGQPNFRQQAGIWADVAATRGKQMVADGVLTEVARSTAEQEYTAWVESEAQSMTLYLEAVEGVVR